jgi:hypothetical protein
LTFTTPHYMSSLPTQHFILLRCTRKFCLEYWHAAFRDSTLLILFLHDDIFF